MTSWYGRASSVTGPLWGESTCDRWIPHTEQAVERDIRIAGDLSSCDVYVMLVSKSYTKMVPVVLPEAFVTKKRLPFMDKS